MRWTKRLYVPRSRYGEIVDGLRAGLEATRVGPGARAVRRVNCRGVGRELGREGLLEFTETHVMSVPS